MTQPRRVYPGQVQSGPVCHCLPGPAASQCCLREGVRKKEKNFDGISINGGGGVGGGVKFSPILVV